MADIDAQFAAGGGNALGVKIVTEGCEKTDIHSEQAQIVRNIPPHAAESRRHPSRVGVTRHHRRKGAPADIDIDAARHHRVSTGAQNITLSGDVALAHQIGDMHRHGGSCDSRALRQRLL